MASSGGLLEGFDPCDLENWCEAVGTLTFATSFIPLSHAGGEAFTHAFDDHRYGSEKVTPAEQALMDEIAAEIDDLIASKYPDGVFVRLSTKSPKDVVLQSDKLESMLSEALEGAETEEEAVIAVVSCCSKAMRAMSGREAVEMIAHSSRTRGDLVARCVMFEPDDFRMNVVVREFCEIRPELEFRGFCHNGVFTACSQYYKSCYCAEIADNADDFELAVQACFAQVSPLLPAGLASYVIDFVVDPATYTCRVVELNPFDVQTAPALFNWADDADRAIMENGPFEFRYLRKPVPGVRDTLYGPLREMVDRVLPPPEAEEEQSTCAVL